MSSFKMDDKDIIQTGCDLQRDKKKEQTNEG